MPSVEIKDMRPSTSQEPQPSLKDILEALKRIESRMDTQAKFNKRIEKRLDDQDEDLTSLHQDLQAIHTKLDIAPCDHDGF